MKEYLDKAKAIMHLADIALMVSPDELTPPEDVPYRKAEYGGLADAIDALEKMEPADAIEVVRCKDCKHCYVDGENVRFNVCELDHNKVQSGEWFCADGRNKYAGTQG